MGIQIAVTGTDAWRTNAACYPEDQGHLWFSDLMEDQNRALEICSSCQVSNQCMDYFLRVIFADGGSGIWGGRQFSGERVRCYECRDPYPLELFPKRGRLCFTCSKRNCERCGGDNMPVYMGVGRRHDICIECKATGKSKPKAA